MAAALRIDRGAHGTFFVPALGQLRHPTSGTDFCMAKKKAQQIGRVDEVVEVALRLFLERGYDNTPMSLLARRLGLTKAGIYHHFASKEDLLFLVHRTAMERGLKPVFEAAAQESDAERRLRVFLYEYARMLSLDPAAMLLIREAR